MDTLSRLSHDTDSEVAMVRCQVSLLLTFESILLLIVCS